MKMRASPFAGPKRRDMDEWRFATDALAAAVNAQGAELQSLAHVRWGELLWQAGPAWPQHAPNLFPIVGQLTGDVLRSGGKSYPLTRHGFARRRRFTWVERRPRGATLQLETDAETLAVFPYPFRLQIDFELNASALTVSYRVDNPGPEVLPASVGAHPAFRWPLVDGAAKETHTLEFARPEPEPIRRLRDGLLDERSFPTPVEGSTLRLNPALFVDDAIVMDRPASRSVRYSAPGAPAIDVSWERFAQLGVWSKPGGDFICIEPWYGYASPVGFDGPFETKPGLLHVAAGAFERLTMHIAIVP
jgi:galactose mutarotase-like enzyme